MADISKIKIGTTEYNLKDGVSYRIPNGGIPASDLDQSVQNSLTLANSALLSHLDISGKVNTADLATVATSGSYNDLLNKPAIPSLSGYATETYVNNKFEDVLGVNADGVSALKALTEDSDAATGLLNEIGNKVNKVSGKGLSTEDYTTTEKNKLSGIETGAQVHKAPTTAEVKSALGTGSGTSKYLREDGSWVTPPNDNTTYSAATTSTAGLMSASDKSKLDGIAAGATNTAAVTESTVAGWGFTKNTGTLTSHQSVSSSNPTASWGSAVTVGTVGGTDLKFTMPANPNTTPVTSVAGNTGAVTAAQIGTALTSAGYKLTDTDTNTWRPVQCNSTDIGSNTLNIVAGSNVTLSRDGGKITISSTDTNTTYSKLSQFTNDSGYITGITKSMVTTALGYTPPTSDTNTVTSINGKTGAIAAADMAAVLTAAGYKLTDTDTNTWRPVGTGASDAAAGNHTHGISLATDSGTNQITLAHGTKYKLTAGGLSVIFTTPTDNNTTYSFTDKNATLAWGTKSTIATVGGTDIHVTMPANPNTNTTYSAGSGLSLSGTTFSLALTKALVTTALGYTPPTSDTNTTYSAGTGLGLSGTTFSVSYGTSAGTACQGNDSRLSNSRPASDVYSWAKASSKPSYSYSEISGTPSSLPASDVYSWAKASSKPSYTLAEVGASMSATTITSNTSSTCSITGSGNAGKSQTIVYVNGGSSDLTVTVPTTYKTPKNAAIEVKCPAGGYCEVNYINIGGTIYARGA